MWLDLLLFSISVLAIGWAFDQRNERIMAQRDLKKERSLTETLGRLNGQLRTRLEEAQARVVGHVTMPRPQVPMWMPTLRNDL